MALAHSIETKARDMSELVSKVLDLMRFDSGELTLRREWESIDDLVAAALAHDAEQAYGPSSAISRCPPICRSCSSTRRLIVQVLANLLDNAAKYTPAGTAIAVSAVGQDGFVRVTVDDDGPGFPAGDPERLFEKFQRGNDEGTIVGVGLGLSICRAIVTAHGGAISAAARPDGGARLTFTLPTTEAAA